MPLLADALEGVLQDLGVGEGLTAHLVVAVVAEVDHELREALVKEIRNDVMAERVSRRT